MPPELVSATALDALVGLQLSGTGLAADMLMFDFGLLHTTPRGGRAGTHALHVQCPWRLCSAGRIVTGSDDLAYFHPPDQRPEDWRYDQGGSLQAYALDRLVQRQPRVTGVSVDPLTGDARISLDDLVLEIRPMASVGEHWRFFSTSPGADHIVCGDAC